MERVSVKIREPPFYRTSSPTRPRPPSPLFMRKIWTLPPPPPPFLGKFRKLRNLETQGGVPTMETVIGNLLQNFLGVFLSAKFSAQRISENWHRQDFWIFAGINSEYDGKIQLTSIMSQNAANSIFGICVRDSYKTSEWISKKKVLWNISSIF